MESAAYRDRYVPYLSELAGAVRLLRAAAVSLFAAASSRTSGAEEQTEQNLQAEKILDDYGNSILRMLSRRISSRTVAVLFPGPAALRISSPFIKSLPRRSWQSRSGAAFTAAGRRAKRFLPHFLL